MQSGAISQIVPWLQSTLGLRLRWRNLRRATLPLTSKLPRGFIRLDPWELEYLFMVAQQARSGIVEIGRRHGGSTFALACANADVPIHSIDIDPRNDDKLRGYFEKYSVGANINLITGDSQSGSYPEIKAYDVLFIDGDHSREGCAADLANWYDALAPAGHIVLHDCFLGTGVQQAVLDFVARTGVGFVQPPYIGTEYWNYPAGSLAHLVKP